MTNQIQMQPDEVIAHTFDYRQPSNSRPVSMKCLHKKGDVEDFETYEFPGQHTHCTSDEDEALLRLRVEA